MRSEILTFTPPLLILTILLMLFVPPARAQSFGNDDQEFDVGSSLSPTYVGLNETFTSSMAWSSSPPYNRVSMQYNPDLVTSQLYQWGSDWFQTGIVSDVYGCGSFTIQVYNIAGQPVWRADQPTSDCSQGYLSQGATWTILEEGFFTWQSETRIIGDVYFSISAANGASSSYTLATGNPGGATWKWLRSNLCWCGTDGGSTAFTSGSGVSTVYADANVNSIDAPIITSTLENSNMLYQDFTSSGTHNMQQVFAWYNPPSGTGGGGLCGSKTTG